MALGAFTGSVSWGSFHVVNVCLVKYRDERLPQHGEVAPAPVVGIVVLWNEQHPERRFRLLEQSC